MKTSPRRWLAVFVGVIAFLVILACTTLLSIFLVGVVGGGFSDRGESGGDTDSSDTDRSVAPDEVSDAHEDASAAAADSKGFKEQRSTGGDIASETYPSDPDADPANPDGILTPPVPEPPSAPDPFDPDAGFDFDDMGDIDIDSLFDTMESRFDALYAESQSGKDARVSGFDSTHADPDDTPEAYDSSDSSQAPIGSQEYTEISTGDRNTCAIRVDGSVDCWGHNNAGQSDPPPGSFRNISTAHQQSCAIRSSDDSIVCWGSNSYWSNGSRDKGPVPLGRFTELDTGSRHSCAIRSTDGTIDCWGWNHEGQSSAPQGTFIAVGTGYKHSCAIRDDMTIVCWGADDAQTTAPSGEFIAIAAGDSHSCAIRTDGTIICWGKTSYDSRAINDAVNDALSDILADLLADQQPDQPNSDHSQANDNRDTFVAVSAGDDHTCAIRNDQSISCWGSNEYGKATPPTSGAYTAISVEERHSCAIRTDGAIACWGDNSRGQLKLSAASGSD